MNMSKTAKSPNPFARLDAIIETVERCREEADEIIDSHVAFLREMNPGVPVSTLRTREITARAGSTLDIAAALKIVRQSFGQ
jgi:hypothetical protein